ncbi:MAG: hypothetical protein IPL61_26885 [Myxococcales bacterium]|nr:hypothetical protein [Myxococcales bacterium]
MIRIELAPWQPVRTAELVGVAALAALLAVLVLGDDSGWTPVVDGANLAFHEAGHMVYGVFGATAALYGGVLGQLTFPVATAATFFLRRQPHGVAVGVIWFGQNLWNIARYMADARAQELPLVGGGEHDFTNIFTRWHVLGRDTTIAAWTRGLGWALVAGALAWLAWRWRRDARAAGDGV